MAKKLLLADDSVTIQKVVGISFANEDLELITVDNGDDAVLRAREARPDVILADVVMPGKNGYEVCEAVKRDPALAHIPVLLLTGTFEAFDEERAASAGADGHITKPFEAQALVDKVNELLARGAAAAAPAPAPVAAGAPPVAATATDDADDDGFDFFDDELESDSGPARENATTAFELDAGESAFDFAPLVEDPAAATAPPVESPTVSTPPSVPAAAGRGMPDATIALGTPFSDSDAAFSSSADAGWSDADLDAAFGESNPGHDAADPEDDPSARTTVFQLDPPSPAAPAFSMAAVEASTPAEDHADEFSFSGGPGDDDFLGDFDAPDAPREAISNPELGRDFAVSSSDLGDPLGSVLEADLETDPGASFQTEPTREPVYETAPPSSFDPDFPTMVSLDAPAEEPIVSPDETSFAQGAGPIFDATPEAEEAPFHLAAQSTEVPIDGPQRSAFDPLLEARENLFTPLAEALAEDFAPPPPERPSAGSGGNGPDLSPMMRERVHEAMEKIAWEAFADLPDQIVRQALAKIEAIAWEVIPQMAEAMIQEEIRRMKGESE